MTTLPITQYSLAQFRALTDLIASCGRGEVQLYVRDDYVHIEMTGRGLPINDVRTALGAAPLEQDELDEIRARKEAAERNSRERRDW